MRFRRFAQLYRVPNTHAETMLLASSVTIGRIKHYVVCVLMERPNTEVP